MDQTVKDQEETPNDVQTPNEGKRETSKGPFHKIGLQCRPQTGLH